MRLRDSIIDKYADIDDVLFADGLDEAIIGFNAMSWQVVYSIDKCIAVLSKDMTPDDAIEYLEYNTFNAYVGEKTPIWIDTL